MMKINRKKIISMALATMIAVGSTSAYAATFSDVKNDWAKTYIYRANEQGFEKENFFLDDGRSFSINNYYIF